MSVIENLKCSIDGFEISIKNWELSDNGTTALMGASGSGKTTLAKVLLGIIECPQWSWVLNGIDLAHLAPPERKLGVVFQDFALFPHMSAKENIYFAAKARKVPVEKATQLFDYLNKKLSLESFSHRKAHVLSGGEKQRVALARALMGHPQFLILDEPFSALDIDLRKEARELVKEVLKETQTPCLLITHDREDAEALAQKIYKMERGQIFDFLS